jgi:hypothetical protein
LTSLPGGRFELFTKTCTGKLNHIFQYEDRSWSLWRELGGCLADAPAVRPVGNGHSEVFTRDCNLRDVQRIGHQPDGSWSAWSNFSNPGSDRLSYFHNGLAVTTAQDGSSVVFTVYTYGPHAMDTPPVPPTLRLALVTQNNVSIIGTRRFSGARPAVLALPDRVVVFAKGEAGDLVHSWK